MRKRTMLRGDGPNPNPNRRLSQPQCRLARAHPQTLYTNMCQYPDLVMGTAIACNCGRARRQAPRAVAPVQLLGGARDLVRRRETCLQTRYTEVLALIVPRRLRRHLYPLCLHPFPAPLLLNLGRSHTSIIKHLHSVLIAEGICEHETTIHILRHAACLQ